INDPGFGQVMLCPDIQVGHGEVVGGNQNTGGAVLGIGQPCLIGSISGVITGINNAAVLVIFFYHLDVARPQPQPSFTLPIVFEPPDRRQGVCLVVSVEPPQHSASIDGP